MTRLPKKRANGYALLTVLFMGAVAAILLGMSLPRAAFEAQRGKEEDLIYRGSQYSRAVQLYFRKFRRYPARLEELENTNGVRFLRKRYLDPITKQEEWRIIHIGPAGVFTDSLVYDKPKPKKEGEAGSATAASPPGPEIGPGLGLSIGALSTGMADRLRASAQTPEPGAQPGYAAQTYFNPSQPFPSGTPGVYPAGSFPQPPYPVPGYPGSPVPGATPASTSGIPGAGFQPGIYQPGGSPPTGYPSPGYPLPAFPAGAGPPGAGFPGSPGQFPRQLGIAPVPGGQPFPGAPGTAFPSTPYPSPGTNPFAGAAGASSEAARIIGQILTTPRAAPVAGFQQPMGSSGGATFGGGIAGVASKSEWRGIKVYLDREFYNEWEFVYDYRRDPLLMGAAPGMGGIPGGGIPGQPGAGASAQPSAFGQPGFGQPGFGQPGLGQPGFGQPGFGQPPSTPINPQQPGIPSSPFGQPFPRQQIPIITPGPPR